MRWVDLPPVWLIGFGALVWAQSRVWPLGGGFLGAPLGGALIGTGAALIGAALVQMFRAKTTIVPRHDASALVTGGVFGLSRNPIYLGDALVLAGFALYLGAWPSLVLVPVFMWLISWRFIEGEEARLRRAFGPMFRAYEQQTRRWL
ncbi:isoprenylcysteine carboxylmethyltransferase family protein [uncultured Lentibacter sp.]|uniref:methyltransferase family protein n=1 Tax=uncultured Lentibacter sp. TaxID=1659309 RepID=UPI00261BCCCA|nr:isoprenylcysteine carboxylmethyltransferase family protein [uncultured Lentibacter sp.]